MHRYNSTRVIRSVVAASLLWTATAAVAQATRPAARKIKQPTASALEWAERGRLTRTMIDTHFLREGQRGMSYFNEIYLADPSKKPGAAFAWGVGVQLSALNAAAEVDPTNVPAAVQYALSVDAYWHVADAGTGGGLIGGYDASIWPKGPDRYYDDNQWLVIDFADTYALSKDAELLERAKRGMDFVMSGEDDRLGGGVYWYERKREGKHTCSNAPAAVAALRLYEVTGEKRYFDIGKRLYEWTLKLQDTDGLFFDNMKLDGSLGKAKFSYNTALPIRAACMLYDTTKDKAYLAAAGTMAEAAVKKWCREDGRMEDNACFAHLLSEALIELSVRTGDKRWAEIAERAAAWEWENGRDANGYYAKDWGKAPGKNQEKVELISQASAARAYWRLAVWKGSGK